MSAQRTRNGRPAAPAAVPQRSDELRARRAASRRRTRLARLDLGIGVGCALFVFIVSPGLAITGVLALVTLAACAVSVFVQRRRRRHRAEGASPRERGGDTRDGREARDGRERRAVERNGTRRVGSEVWDVAPTASRGSGAGGGSRRRERPTRDSPEIWDSPEPW